MTGRFNNWHLNSVSEVIRELGTNPERGLTHAEAERRLKEVGPNELKEKGGRSPAVIFFSQFTSIMVLVLLLAGVISVVLGEYVDAGAIFAIVLLNAFLGFIQEYRAERTMQALKRLALPKVRVRRDGRIQEISAPELVPGDIVFLDTGTHIPADGRLIEAINLRVSEAALTGESEPVEKNSGECKYVPGDPKMDSPTWVGIKEVRETEGAKGEEVPLAERRNMVFMGTAVVAGRGVMVVTATGMRTELGKIAEMLETVKPEPTPLQKRLERLARELALAVLVIAGVVFVLGILRGEEYRLMFLITISIAVAAIPEGLPAVVTIALTLGTRRMLARKALIRRLNAVETLGSVTVICSDKTGTLTQNQMTVTMLDVLGDRLDLSAFDGSQTPIDIFSKEGSGKSFLLLIAGGALCNDAEIGVMTDPTEGALILVAERLQLSLDELRRVLLRVGEVPFSSERKRMSTIHRIDGKPKSEPARLLLQLLCDLGLNEKEILFTKGAVDVLLEISSSVFIDGRCEPMTPEWRKRIISAHNRLTQKGMRVLGVAFRPLAREESQTVNEELERNLCFAGMSGMIDPARPEVKEAVAVCQEAGIKPVMITGDHPLTAIFIAEDIGIIAPEEKPVYITGAELTQLTVEELIPVAEKTKVYARVTPRDKLKIVQALQARKEVVAMTGDGVNDAPALKKADIGVAMGRTGTDVAKEAADMVLLDDNFATIVSAVKEGRTIYENILKFIRYTFASNAGEIWTMLLAPFFGMPFPLLPLQILWVNLMTDGLPGIALSVEPPEPDLMQRPPRKLNESPFARGMGFNIIWSGLVLGAVSLLAGYWLWGKGDEPGFRTAVFTTLIMGQLFHSLSLRSQRYSFFTTGLLTNPLLLLTFLLTFIIQLGIIYLPFFQTVFHTKALSLEELLICLALSTATFLAVEIEKFIRRRRRPNPAHCQQAERAGHKKGIEG